MTNNTTSVKSPPEKKPRNTAATRKAALLASQAAAREEQARLDAEFEQNRKANWNEVWAQALRLDIVFEAQFNFVTRFEWLFKDFAIDAVEQTFNFDGYGWKISESNLTRSTYLGVRDALKQVFESFKEYEEDQERERLIELERKQRKSALLAKAKSTFTAEELKLMGLPKA